MRDLENGIVNWQNLITTHIYSGHIRTIILIKEMFQLAFLILELSFKSPLPCPFQYLERTFQFQDTCLLFFN